VSTDQVYHDMIIM